MPEMPEMQEMVIFFVIYNLREVDVVSNSTNAIIASDRDIPDVISDSL